MNAKSERLPSKIVAAGMYAYAALAAMGISGIQAASALVFAALAFSLFVEKSGKIIFADDNRRALSYAALFYVLWGVGASIAAGVFPAALNRLVPFAGAYALFAGFAVLPENFRRKIIVVAVAFASIQAIYAAAQYFTGIDITRGGFTEPYSRVRGTLGYYNSLGGVMGMTLPLAVSMAVFSSETKKRVFYFTASAALALALVFTFTRGAWMGAAAGVAIVCVVRYGRKSLPFILAALLFPLVFGPVRSRLADIVDNPETERIHMWKSAVMLIRKNPASGVGYGSFERFAEEDYARGQGGFKSAHFHPHNIFLTAAIEGGVPSALAVAVILKIMLAAAFGFLKKRPAISPAGAESSERFGYALAVGAAGAFVDFVIHGMVDNVWAGETLYLLWFFAGAVFSL